MTTASLGWLSLSSILHPLRALALPDHVAGEVEGQQLVDAPRIINLVDDLIRKNSEVTDHTWRRPRPVARADQ